MLQCVASDRRYSRFVFVGSGRELDYEDIDH